MKKVILLFLFSLLNFAWVCGQEYVSPQQTLPAHPRLLMPRDAEKPLLAAIRKDPLWKVLHTSILEESDRIIQLPTATYHVVGRRLLDTSREVLRRLFYLSYAYRMTGKEKYASRAREEMLSAASFPEWHPSHFLDVAEMTLGVAIGYDWLYDYLSESDRRLIGEALVTKGMEPSFIKKYSWFYDSSNNWNQVCNAGMTFGAVAAFENNPTMAATLVNKAIRSVPISMKEYGPDGAYPEGIGYWEYGTSFNVLLLDALESNFGSDFGLSELPGFMQTGLYAQQMITPAGNAFGYSDVGRRNGFAPACFWFYKETGDPALILTQKQALEQVDMKRHLRHRLLPLALIWGAGSGASLSEPEIPETLFWTGRGSNPVCVMRTSWSDPDAIYLGFKAGSPSVNHGHMDVGSFYLEADRVRWALDLGMEPYNGVEKAGVDLWNTEQESQRWDVYRLNNFVHNTLTFNDRKQKVAGRCTIGSTGNSPDLMYATSDLTPVCPPWVKQAVRAAALIDREYALIEDRITTGANFTKMRWNMMTEADKVSELGDNLFLLTKGDKKLYVQVISPVKIRCYHRPATPANSYDSPNKGIYAFGFEAELPLKSTQRFRVFLMPGSVRATDCNEPLL